MAFLTVNGIPMSVLYGEAAHKEPEPVGGVNVRSYGGAMLSTVRAWKEVLEFQTAPMLPTEAAAWKGLLLGLGHQWNFETLYSSKGLGPNAGYNASVGAGGKFGGKVTLPASTGTLAYTVGASTNWSVAVYRYEGAWKHYVFSAAGGATSKWVDGVQNDAASTPWITYLGGVVAIAETGGAPRDFDGLTFLPFAMPSTWPASLAAATASFGDLPFVTVSGDAVDGRTLPMLPTYGGGKIIGGFMGGVYRQDLKDFSVTFTEA